MIFKTQRGRETQHSETIGADGLVTLLLSNVVMLLTAGVSLGLSLTHVVRIARNARVVPSVDSVLVVLGMRLRDGEISPDYALRLKRAIEIFKHDHSRYILTVGGCTGGSLISEASKGSMYLISKGVEPGHILTEDASRHTLENLRNVRALLRAKNVSVFTIITNRYHLARSRVIAKGLGLTPELCAAEDEFSLSLVGLPRLLLEAYYIQWYWTGAAWSRITRNRKSLERIS